MSVAAPGRRRSRPLERGARRFVRLVLVLALAASACGDSATPAKRYSRKQAEASLSRARPDAALVLGEYRLDSPAVIDGDTVRVRGLDTSLRLLAIDTEETFKKEKNRRAAESDFDAYLVARRGDNPRPVKSGTPMGEEAKEWARQFFDGVDNVRLERDHPKEIRGRFGRYLVYVFVRRDGAWSNYNLEAVRAGMSPYFTKYSYSRRFHDEFVAAEEEARRARRGIWNPSKQAYRDYDERRAWWNGRADFIRAFERLAAERPNHLVLTNWDAPERLRAHVGKEVVILATVTAPPKDGDRPELAYLSRRQFRDFPVQFASAELRERSKIGDSHGEFVAVAGTVRVAKGEFWRSRGLYLEVSGPGAVSSTIGELERSAQSETALQEVAR